MADEEDVVVTIADDAAVETGKETPDPAVAELKAQYEEVVARDRAREEQVRDANARVAEATRTAEAARQEAKSARSEIADSQADSIASGIAAATAEAEAAEREYKEAFEAGDAAKMAGAQRKIARAEARSVRLDEAKADLEARKSAPEVERTEAPQRAAPQTPADPFEAYIAGRTEPTANWLRAHKDWVTDAKKNAQLTSAHWDAVAHELAPDTPEYFNHVETMIGLKQAPNVVRTTGAATNGAAKPQIQRRPAVPVAPVQASGGGTSGGDTVVLTRGEAAAATDGSLVWNYEDPTGQKRFKKGDPIGVQEMARRKRAMKAQGLYDKQYTEA